MTTQALSVFQTLIDWDTSITLLINGIHSHYWDNFMMLYSGKFVWIPFYLSLVIAMFRNFRWKPCAICLAAMVLLLFMNDQTSSSVLRHAIGRMRPANLDNPISSMIHIVGGYRGGYYGFPSAHAANCWGLVFFSRIYFSKSIAQFDNDSLGHSHVLLTHLPWRTLFGRHIGWYVPGIYQCHHYFRASEKI